MSERNRGNAGDMQSELKPSEFIAEFTSVVPKYNAYSVMTNEGQKIVCKFRDINLNYQYTKLANFDVIRAMILE